MKPKPHRKRAILDWIDALNARGLVISPAVRMYVERVGLVEEVAATMPTPPPSWPVLPASSPSSGATRASTGPVLRHGELWLPGEDRILTELKGQNYTCPRCCWLGTLPVLERRCLNGQSTYRVYCTGPHCDCTTDWLASSQLALAAWKAMIVLERPTI